VKIYHCFPFLLFPNKKTFCPHFPVFVMEEEPKAKRPRCGLPLEERQQLYTDFFGVQQALEGDFEKLDVAVKEDVSKGVMSMVDKYLEADKAYDPFRNPFSRGDLIGEADARHRLDSARQLLRAHASVIKNKLMAKKN